MALSGGYGPVCAAFPEDGVPPSSATLDGKAAHSNNFLRCRRRRSGYDATSDAGEIALAPFDRQSTCSQHRRDSRRPTHSDLARENTSRFQQPGKLGDEGAISIKTIGAAVESQTGVVAGYFTRQIGERGMRNIRRV